MLLKVNNIINKKYLCINNYFFVFNILNFKENFNNKDGEIFHVKQFLSLHERKLIGLFSGNVVFFFVKASKFFDILLNLNYSDIKKYELIGICYNNNFINLNLYFFNVFNCLFVNLFVIFFLILLFINLFFFKLFLLFKNSFIFKKC